METKNYEGIKCPQCGSANKYKRQKTNEWVCRRCSAVFEAEHET